LISGGLITESQPLGVSNWVAKFDSCRGKQQQRNGDIEKMKVRQRNRGRAKNLTQVEDLCVLQNAGR